MVNEVVEKAGPRSRAWLSGWNAGATGKPARSTQRHADEYERGYGLGQEALVSAYGRARMRIGDEPRKDGEV